jgi:hypothetical protein
MFWSLSSDFKSRLGLCLCLSLLKAGILGCVTVDVVLRVFVLRISLVGWANSCRQVLQSDLKRSWYLSSHQLLLPAGQD